VSGVKKQVARYHSLLLYLSFSCKSRQKESRRADSNRLPLLQLRVITQALQAFAQGCRLRLDESVSLLCHALCCAVLRSRWCQSGVKIHVTVAA